MFAHQLFEFFNDLERDIVLLVSEIHERTSVGAVLGDQNFDRGVWINPRTF